MRFYVATRLENFEEQRELASFLERHSEHVQTYDWTADLRAGLNFPELWRSRSEHQMKTTGLAEIQGVLTADVVVAILPGGRGTHVELGLALGSGAKLILVMPPDMDWSVPFYHCADRVVLKEDEWMFEVEKYLEEV